MTQEQLRDEQKKRCWRKKVFEFKGERCAACGTTEDLEIHHVLALKNGGTNDFNNLIVLCQKHHCQIHQKVHQKAKNPGRKIKVSYEEAIPFLKKYFSDEIGSEELVRALGYTARTNATVLGYRERYIKENKVCPNYKNTIAIKRGCAAKRKEDRP